jgi:hypothetical protein
MNISIRNFFSLKTQSDESVDAARHPREFAKNLEKQCDNDGHKLYQHFTTLDRATQKQVLEHSTLLRGYVEIRDSSSFGGLIERESPKQTIPRDEAPEGWAMAVTLSNSDSRIKRAFDHLHRRLDHVSRNKEGVSPAGWNSLENAFAKLVQDVGHIKSEKFQLEAVCLVRYKMEHLSPKAKAHLGAVAQKAMRDNPYLPKDVKSSLQEIVKQSLPEKTHKHLERARFHRLMALFDENAARQLKYPQPSGNENNGPRTLAKVPDGPWKTDKQTQNHLNLAKVPDGPWKK